MGGAGAGASCAGAGDDARLIECSRSARGPIRSTAADNDSAGSLLTGLGEGALLPDGHASCDRGVMPTRLVHLVVDAADPATLAHFWSAALEWPITFEEPDEVVIEPPENDPAQEGQLPLVFVPVAEPKTTKNRIHLDLASSSADHQAALVC